jgi:hypothetical protein
VLVCSPNTIPARLTAPVAWVGSPLTTATVLLLESTVSHRGTCKTGAEQGTFDVRQEDLGGDSNTEQGPIRLDSSTDQ